jgi:plastocyanin
MEEHQMRGSGLVCVAVAITACGGGGDGGNGGTNPPPQVATVVITSPAAAQTISACGSVNLAAEARNAQGGVVSTTIAWQSSDQSKVALTGTSGTTNTGRGIGIGSSTITASANSGTVVSNPGVTVTVQGGGASNNADVDATASNTFSPNCVTINAGGRVSWNFAPSPAHNVKFQGAAPTGGNINDTQNATVSRTFPNAGTYSYLCDLHAGMTGIVVVQ